MKNNGGNDLRCVSGLGSTRLRAALYRIELESNAYINENSHDSHWKHVDSSN
jgi:hypothetical protein